MRNPSAPGAPVLRPTAAVERLKQYQPPLGGRTGLRLDFNENNAGCSPRVLARLRSLTAEDLSKYPEREPIEAAVAQWLGLEPAQVLLTNGVDEGIHLLAETFLAPGSEAVIVVPTFSMYEIYAAATGAQVVRVQAGRDFEFPLARLVESITRATRLIAIANPNNPTGTVATREALLSVADAAPQAALLIDEAYFDFFGESVADEINRRTNLFVARTFSKAYGMAGLRVGVLAGPAPLMMFLRRAASPYNVNGVALACLPEAIADQEYVSQYVTAVRHGRARLEAELRALGLRYWKSAGNFVLVRVGAAREAFVARMRQHGILVRDRNNDPGCAGCVRITVGVGEQADTLISALRAVMADLGDALEVFA